MPMMPMMPTPPTAINIPETQDHSPSTTVVGTPDDKSIIIPHHEMIMDVLTAVQASS